MMSDCVALKVVSLNNLGCKTIEMLSFLEILETFLEAFFFFIIPVFATFISSEFNLGKNLIASDFFFFQLKVSFFLLHFCICFF